MFDQLLEQLNQSILSHGGHQIELKSSLVECFSKKGDGVIRNWLWEVPGFRRWRVTRMDIGNKVQVLNSVAYPEYIKDQPILGMDFILFGIKQKLIAVLDYQPLIQDEDYFLQYFQGLKILRNHYKDFNQREKMHIYDSNKYFSPWLLLYNGNHKKVSYPLSKILPDFLDSYWNIHEPNDNKYIRIDPDEVKRLHIDYDRYNAEIDPAHGLFKSYFGKDWADEFLYDFLFPNSLKNG